MATDEFSLGPYRRATSERELKSSVYYRLMLELDTPVLGDPRASLSPLPRGHIKADTTQALTQWKSGASSAETCLFSLPEPWKAVFLYQPTHIY